jgi:hypothetical protein
MLLAVFGASPRMFDVNATVLPLLLTTLKLEIAPRLSE